MNLLTVAMLLIYAVLAKTKMQKKPLEPKQHAAQVLLHECYQPQKYRI